MEGMRGFLARHADALSRDRTRVVVLECVAGPEPILLEGEGMLRMHDYTPAVRDWLADCAQRAGRPLRRRLRTGFATDALIALRRGYPTGVLASVDRYKMAANYHSPRDRAAHVGLRHRRRDVRGLPRGRALAQLPGSQLPGPRDSVLARRDRAGEAVLLELGEQPSEPRAGREAELARELVAAQQRRRPAGRRQRERRAEQLARHLEVRGDRRLGVAPARREAVGHGEARVTSAL